MVRRGVLSRTPRSWGYARLCGSSSASELHLRGAGEMRAGLVRAAKSMEKKQLSKGKAAIETPGRVAVTL